MSAVGTRDARLLFGTLLLCSLELLGWLSVLAYAVAEFVYDTDSPRVLFQWAFLAAAVSLLFMCWTLLLATWKRRRREQLVAMHTARKGDRARTEHHPFPNVLYRESLDFIFLGCC